MGFAFKGKSRKTTSLGGHHMVIGKAVSAASALQIVNKNAGVNTGWDGAAWAPTLSKTGDFVFTLTTETVQEIVIGVATGTRSFPGDVPSYGQCKYGILRYQVSGETYQVLDGGFTSQTFNTPGAGVVWTIQRTGTTVLIKEGASTIYTIGSVDPSISCYPYIAANFAGVQNQAATFQGAAINWTDFYQTVAQ